MTSLPSLWYIASKEIILVGRLINKFFKLNGVRNMDTKIQYTGKSHYTIVGLKMQRAMKILMKVTSNDSHQGIKDLCHKS